MKKVLVGTGIGIMLTLSTAAYASDSIQALIFPVKIKINGHEKQLDSEYQILNVNGHAYVPIRYVAENTGINIGYDDNSHTIYLANEGTPIRDNTNELVHITDLIVTTDKYKETTKTTGHLFLDTEGPSYINAVLEFYDDQSNLLGNAVIDGDYLSGKNIFDIRGESDFTNYSSVVLKVRDVHIALKSTILSLFEAAKENNQSKVQSIIASIPDETNEFLLVDFLKWSVPYSNELREYLLPDILNKKVNVNFQDKSSGYTPLMYSSRYSLNLIKPLIESGADVRIKGNDGTTALLLIASKNQPELVRLLLDKGSDPNVVAANGYTPLLSALRPLFAHYTEDTVNTIKYLLDAGAKVNVKLPDGTTPQQIVDGIQEPLIAAQLGKLLKEYEEK